MAALQRLPALVALEQIAVPVLVIGHDGTVLFANTAFADMMGYRPDEALSLRFEEVFLHAQESDSVLATVHALANTVVEMAHKDGSVVRAMMSNSATTQVDDQFAIAAFQDLTEQLWEEATSLRRGSRQQRAGSS
ncbi:MAG: PAS domain-containing protein [Actinomycetota bacterium]|nr:PAS domain-containing protein [Actinomycetota bacterium]